MDGLIQVLPDNAPTWLRIRSSPINRSKGAVHSASHFEATAEAQAYRGKLTVIMHADMVAYSRLISLDEVGTIARLRRIRNDIFEPEIARTGGVISETAGDSFLAIFDSIGGALQGATAIQGGISAFESHALPDQIIRFRIGINIGDAILDGTGLHGESVNIAARLQSVCPPGSICVSRTVRDHSSNLPKPGLRFERLGMLKLKNITRPVDAFVLIFDVTAPNLTRVRRLVSGFLPVQQFRRLGAFLAATAPAAIAATVLSFGNLNFYLPLYKEAARAEARHAEEMVRLQALNATQASLVHETEVLFAALDERASCRR